jgi:putative cofactor-binding repeat protein
MRRFQPVLAFLIVVVGAQSVVAATYYVGGCRKGAFSSIQTAVSTVPAGSIIDVCPGTYAEQVAISQSLTLRGISDGNSSQVIIAAPSAGLTTTTSIIFGTIAPQVEVMAGPVKITGITVDGSASCPVTGVHYAAIFYSSGSSGTVSEVETRNQNCNLQGLGILAENGAGASQTVTIVNNNVHDNDFAAIYAYSDQMPSTLTTSIKSNYVAGEDVSIFLNGTVAGSISGNTIASGYGGVYVGSASSSVTGNTVSPAEGYGIYVNAAAVISGNTLNNLSNTGTGIFIGSSAAGASVASNHISNISVGISSATGGATIKNNIITKAGSMGIEFNCNTDTVSGNIINGAPIGLDMVPAAFNGVNHFYNVATDTTGGC